jgi:hypothetical protein
MTQQCVVLFDSTPRLGAGVSGTHSLECVAENQIFSLSGSAKGKKKVAGLHKQTATGAEPGNRIGNHQPRPGVSPGMGEHSALA